MSDTKANVNSIDINDIQKIFKWKNEKIIECETEIKELRKHKEWIMTQLEQLKGKCDSYVEIIVLQQKTITLFESFSEEYSRIKSHNKDLDEVIVEMNKKYENDMKQLKEKYGRRMECQKSDLMRDYEIAINHIKEQLMMRINCTENELNKTRNECFAMKSHYESIIENSKRELENYKENAEQMMKKNSDLWQQKVFCQKKEYEMKIETLMSSKMKIETQLNDAICENERLKVMVKKYTKNVNDLFDLNVNPKINSDEMRVTFVEPIKTMHSHQRLVKTQLQSDDTQVMKPQPSRQLPKRKKLKPIDNSYLEFLSEIES